MNAFLTESNDLVICAAPNELQNYKSLQDLVSANFPRLEPVAPATFKFKEYVWKAIGGPMELLPTTLLVRV